ncbi:MULTISPECIES: response regulator [Aequorivita]|uniref:Response regulator n=2 Tax=Aequorivita TaxID=153265 RepID=A0AB35YT52_9FLAO|nr:response regulator [Aequorivita sp. Ant34-E75]WGF92160.1 response regulator [Aequorivita sp. Ant34-E75]
MREILLIDDDPIINLINTRVIKSQFPDLPITALKSGVEALEYIREHQTDSYLVFLDIHMPEMNGWEFIANIRKEKIERNLQIHILTSSVDNTDIIKAKENAEVLSYLLKPLKIEVLSSLVG